MQNTAAEFPSSRSLSNATPGETAASRVKSVSSWIVLAGLIGLLVWGSRHNPWLWKRIESTPPGYVSLWIFLIGAVILSTRFADGLWSAYRRACQRICDGLLKRPWLGGAAVISLSACFFGYFRIQRVDAGDILEWIMAGKQGKAFLVEHAPLETLIRCWISEIHRLWPAADLIVVYKILICLYGGIFVWAVLWFSARMERPYRFLAPLFFFSSSAMSVYFGYLEVYGAANLAQSVFLLAALQCFLGKRSAASASFWLGLALAMGFWHGVLLPAYLYLLWKMRRGLHGVDWVLQVLLLILPTLLALIGLIPYANPFAGIITRLSEPSVLIPFSPFAQAMGYTLWGARHLADWAAETLLIAPVAIGLLTCRLLCDFSRIRRIWKSAAFRFALIACAAGCALGFFYHPVLGFPLDWDLYTFMHPSFALFGVMLMNDIERTRLWRKRLIALALAAAALASCWTLQNALFWRYPLLLSKAGPIVSPFIPDFYYKNMQRAFERSNQANLYWLADRALEESPELYREILTFMDDWTVSTLSQLPPLAFDYPGWTCDLALLPGGGDRALIFDRLGRLFLYDGAALKWIFAPKDALPSQVAAGDVEADGSAILLCEDGRLLRVEKEVLDQGAAHGLVWGDPIQVCEFLPDSPSERNLPVRMVDVAVRSSDEAICAVDNFNRVWDITSRTLLLTGLPSYNLTQALHFTYDRQPVVIDVNNQLSYDREKVKLPFPTAWFHPIVRDFLFTPDEQGLMVLDLNGNIHYMGAAPIYKSVVLPGDIVDRYEKMAYLAGRDALLLLDNRCRLREAGLDADGSTARQKISSMIDAGSFGTAFNILSVLWRRSSIFTPICYEMMDTEIIRDIPGAMMYRPEDAISMYVDLLPVEDDLSILIDRWGRLTAYNKGVLFLLEGTGLASWPRTEAIDGALADGKAFFLCKDGTVWRYEFNRFFGEQTSPFQRTPSLWQNLKDYGEEEQWIGVEDAGGGRELIAMSAKGKALRLPIDGGAPREEFSIPGLSKPVFDFDYRDAPDGFSVAYTSDDGPAYVYTSRDQMTHEAPNSYFGWPVISDIRFSKGDDIVLLDKYGVIHQYDSVYRFSGKPYSVIMDAVALRFLQSGGRAQWLRSNGEIQTLRVREF